MPIIQGTRLGAYEILSPLGAGGMGEVYRARDTRLKRDVAMKVLPEAFAQDPDRLARFQREAELLATLNHPNIAAVYGLEQTDGVTGIVLELVEGETLDARLKASRSTQGDGFGDMDREGFPSAALRAGGRAGGLPLDEALAIARQIVDALEAAHEKGVIHRDLKPANIKVTADGKVKVLDFGLAKALDPAASSAAALANSPTITTPAMMTGIGTILGTAAYMAPEQARGASADKRADIWAFGVVLFEMLTGQPLFRGESVTEMLASVIKDEPDLSVLPVSTPTHVRRLLARCLARDPKVRLRDIGEARIVLSMSGQGGHDEAEPAAGVTAASARQRVVPWVVAAVATLAAVAVGIVAWRPAPVESKAVRRFDLGPDVASAEESALAPDGTQVAYLNRGRVLVRALDTLQPRDLGAAPASTHGLFWSPDSRTIAFSAEGALRSVPAAGGPVFNICKVPATGRIIDAAWREDGTIVFSTFRDSLYKVSARGGPPEIYLAVDGAKEVDFHDVSALPDNRVILKTHLQGDTLRTETFDGKNRRILMEGSDSLAYAPPGYLTIARTGENKGFWVLPFSDGPLDLAKATLVEPGASVAASNRGFDTAADGTALVLLGPETGTNAEFVWVDRGGTATPAAGKPVAIADGPALSPDGGRAVFALTSPPGVFVRDLESGVDTRLTFEEKPGMGERDNNVGWFPSSDRVFYRNGAIESRMIVVRQADGSGNERELAAGTSARVSPDGRSLFVTFDDRGRKRLRVASIAADGAVGARVPVFASGDEPDIATIDVSPDGRLLAYAARASTGRLDVFLTTLPGGSGRWEVVTGGSRPQFSRDGKELFFLTGLRDAAGQTRGQFMVVPVTSAPTVTLGARRPLFELGKLSGSFGVSPDGRRFLMARPPAAESRDERRVVLIQNWPAAINK